MDFNLKQWRHHDSEQTQEEDQEDTNSSDGHPSLKLPKLLLNTNNSSQYYSTHHHHHQNPSSALPLFVPEPNSNLSANYNSSSDSPASTKSNPRMGSSFFSLGQWQELELQALIYRHMISGTPVPTELLHLVKKSLISSNPPPYYHPLSHSLHQYYPQYQPALVQSGYWGRGAMDPEPGRCRRTDGKKWRCSRDVVPGQKYCERHVHRGRNRSRKPVEIPTSTVDSLKTTLSSPASQGMASVPHFTLSGPSPSMDLLHHNRRPSDSMIERKGPFEAHNEAQPGGDRTLRHFFDDWPRSLHDADSTTNSATNLSISTPGNLSSDFSLKLGTGAGDESSARGERERTHLNWTGTWEANPVAPMGGPLAEALRSSTSNTSPTSVLHRLRASNSEASYVSS